MGMTARETVLTREQSQSDSVKTNNFNAGAMDPLLNANDENVYARPTHNNNSIYSGPVLASAQNAMLMKVGCMKVGCIVVITLCLSSLAMAIFAVATYDKLVDELKTAREHRGKVCLPCSTASVVLESWASDRQGECCIHLEDLLSIMKKVAANEVATQLKKVSAAVYLPSENVSASVPLQGQRRASAHLVIDSRLQAAQGAGSAGAADLDGTVITNWDAHARASHLTAPLRYEGGCIIAPDYGYYFVYSQVNMVEVPSSSSSVLSPSTIAHSLWRRHRFSSPSSSDRVEVLMRGRQSTCWSKDKSFDFQTSYLGGVAYLEKGDEIFVRASNASHLSTDNMTTFFGVIMI